MPRNDAAAPGHVCPGMRIHAIDIVQPPGIGISPISPIADIDVRQTIVTAALAAKSSPETPKKARSEARTETMRPEIARPEVASTTSMTWLSACRTCRGGATRRPSRCAPWGTVEPLVHAPEAVQSARIGGIGVVDDAVLEYERAHARLLAHKRGRVRSGHRRDLGDRPVRRRRLPRPPALVVVLGASRALLLLG